MLPPGRGGGGAGGGPVAGDELHPEHHLGLGSQEAHHGDPSLAGGSSPPATAAQSAGGLVIRTSTTRCGSCSTIRGSRLTSRPYWENPRCNRRSLHRDNAPPRLHRPAPARVPYPVRRPWRCSGSVSSCVPPPCGAWREGRPDSVPPCGTRPM